MSTPKVTQIVATIVCACGEEYEWDDLHDGAEVSWPCDGCGQRLAIDFSYFTKIIPSRDQAEGVPSSSSESSGHVAGTETTGQPGAMRPDTPAPHAYFVEVLVNPGSRSERWERDMDSEYRSTRAEAEADRDEYVADLFAPDQVRVAAVVALGGVA